MANIKISDLTALEAQPSTDDYFVIVDTSEAADADKTKKIDFGYAIKTYADSLVNVTGVTTYTPTWTAQTTNPSLGNGSINGRYYRIGNVVTVFINLTMGSTTTYGSGEWWFSMPFTWKESPGANMPIGYGRYTDAGNQHYGGPVVIGDNAKVGCMAFPAAYPAYLNWVAYNVPFTWGKSDELEITFSYLANIS